MTRLRSPVSDARIPPLRRVVPAPRDDSGGLREKLAPYAQRENPVIRGLAVVGALLLASGFGAILLGWYGAAHTPYVFEQLPYLISGGLLGIAMVFAGGLLYVASWVARAASDHRHEMQLMRAALERLHADRDRHTTALLVATERGTMLHRADCPAVAGRRLRPVTGTEPELRPCRLCQPDDAA